jgi:mxaJ protein
VQATPSPRRRRGLLALVCSLTLLAPPAFAQPWELAVCADFNAFPFSRRDGVGFDLDVVRLLAADLGATVTIDWDVYGVSMIRDKLREGICDLIMGVPDGANGLLSTVAYYRSPLVFVYRSEDGFDVDSFDSPDLARARIGIQSAAGPEHQALMVRGLGDNIDLMFTGRGGQIFDDPLRPLLQALIDGAIDVAITWGPNAGYYAAEADVPLTVRPGPDFEAPFTPLFINMTIGVRRGDEALRDLLNDAITRNWEGIDAILDAYYVPRLPLPRSPGGARR